jgi:hypothetical protein
LHWWDLLHVESHIMPYIPTQMSGNGATCSRKEEMGRSDSRGRGPCTELVHHDDLQSLSGVYMDG